VKDSVFTHLMFL